MNTIIRTLVVFGMFVISLAEHRIGFDKYHKHVEMTNYLKKITNEFSNISSLYSIGTSVKGRELWAVKLTTATNLQGVPNIKIVGNVHGNEPVGREIILHLIEYLLENNLKNKTINKLLRTTVIHLLPSMNPDGFELAQPQPCPNNGSFSTGYRYNANSFDLNRNFPDVFNPHSRPMQKETSAIIEWMRSVPFVMSLGLHGGALVANYPYDGSPDSFISKLERLNETLKLVNLMELFEAFNNVSGIDDKTHESLTPDDDVFRFLARLYAKLHPTMHKGLSCGDDEKFKDGITNGATWYEITGSMQDYNYAWHGCMEITLELSCCKYPPASYLEYHWKENLKPLLTWMQQAQRGVRGIVTNQFNGKPISNATLSIYGREKTFSTTENGEYWKILLPGIYKMRVTAAGHDDAIVKFQVPKQEDPSDGPKPVHVNVAMVPTDGRRAATGAVDGKYYTYKIVAEGTGATTAVDETTARRSTAGGGEDNEQTYLVVPSGRERGDYGREDDGPDAGKDGGGNGQDDGDFRPPLPVHSLASVADRVRPDHRRYPIAFATTYSVLCYVAARGPHY